MDEVIIKRDIFGVRSNGRDRTTALGNVRTEIVVLRRTERKIRIREN